MKDTIIALVNSRESDTFGGVLMADEEKTATPTQLEDNIVYVGKKGIMSYVLAVVTQFNSGVSEVSIKARGRAISRAVDVAEIIRNKFINEVKIKDIKVQTEELQNEDGSTSKVSAIDIVLTK